MNATGTRAGLREIAFSVWIEIFIILFSLCLPKPFPIGKDKEMMVWAIWGWVPAVLNILIVLLSLFMILLVLIQRGKGGGLAGAFGGMGGSSAFGSRAGDMFTRITLVVAGVWLLLAMTQVVILQGAVEDAKGEDATILRPGGEK
jgi:protein translocase SecG subunit